MQELKKPKNKYPEPQEDVPTEDVPSTYPYPYKSLSDALRQEWNRKRRTGASVNLKTRRKK